MRAFLQFLFFEFISDTLAGGYLQRVNEIYTHDAYHSLSIEGYQVTPELIQRIADGVWNPTENPEDQGQINAMAAKGYLQRVNEIYTHDAYHSLSIEG